MTAMLVAACLAAALPAAAAPSHTPAPTPSVVPTGPTTLNTQAGVHAQQAKDRADRAVAALRKQIAAESTRLSTVSATASLAEQRWTAGLAVQADAHAAELAAERRVTTAQAQFRYSQEALNAAAVAAYESGSGADALDINTLGSLLVAPDPSAVLDVSTQRVMLVAHQGDVMAQMELAAQNLRIAEQQRKDALAAVAAQTAHLAEIRAQAETALAEQSRTVTSLTADLHDANATQQQADAALSTFLGGWSSADPKRAGELNGQYAKLALKAARAKPAPPGPHWTAAMGHTAVARALQYLGVDYAWAGGNADGPTQGLCVAGPAHADCAHVGFDCSGLALYAWAPYLAMAHFAATQYLSGAVHPAPTELVPGDLVFWSSNGSEEGIHHVAIYVGAGNVIQAPQSGDIVRITPLGEVSSGYFGATRPLT
ncbi:MAG: C40 family peptidase [Jatrophihabitantaceae bacterium]